MGNYPCLHFPVVGQQCRGTMMRVKSEHRGKLKFVCNRCLREGWWWSEKWDRDTD